MTHRRSEFDELVTQHARLMSSAIRRVCGRRHQVLVPDVEQEVRLALWKRLGSGKKIDYPISYLYKMALTTALAVVRKHRPDLLLPMEEERPERLPPPAEDGLEPVERSRLIDEVLASLDIDEARALRAYLAGFNHRETAELFGWSESVARHRIYRTLELLRERAAANSKQGEVVNS
ncbi:MAG: sigma-70 family RNA polymerase sigma factor [Thermoanaerobaculia bacterium]|nr:sigma-70 family RNA polymerase sigma factor [Thermoanaerobaculia bacterium]